MAESRQPPQFQDGRFEEEFLTCPLCYCVYTNPKVLQCQHVFCAHCLEQTLDASFQLQREVSCPMCRRVTALPAGHIENLPASLVVSNLLAFLEACEQQRADPTESGNDDTRLPAPPNSCTVCEDGSNKLKWYCRQCRIWLCDPCHRHHNRLPATATHTPASLDSLIDPARAVLKEILGEGRACLAEMDEQQVMVDSAKMHLEEKSSGARREMRMAADKLRAALTTLETEAERQIARLEEAAQDVVEGEENRILSVRESIEEGLREITGVLQRDEGFQLLQLLPSISEMRQNFRQAKKWTSAFPPPVTVFQPSPSLLSVFDGGHIGRVTSIKSLDKSGRNGESAGDENSEEESHFCLWHRQHLPQKFFISSLAMMQDFSLAAASNVCNVHVTRIKVRGSQEIEDLQRPFGVAALNRNHIVVTCCGTGPGDGSLKILTTTPMAVVGMPEVAREVARGMSLPRGLCVTRTGQVYVCDEMDRCVYIFSEATWELVRVLSRSREGKQLFEAPRFVAALPDGTVAVNDGGKRVCLLSSSGDMIGDFAAPFPDSELWGMCASHLGSTFLVADWKRGIHVLGHQGFLETQLPLPPGLHCQPTAICLCSAIPEGLAVGNGDGEIVFLQG